jgi:NAD(P)-dependent dehydrogenase (short-subunit alcohol dehydrogenase family)
LSDSRARSELPTAFILGGSADIGRALVERYAADGWFVAATCRDRASVDLPDGDGIRWIPCDVVDPASVRKAAEAFARLGRPWSVFFSSVGTLEPIGRFFDLSFEAWQESVLINSLGQLRVLHALYPHRAPRAAAGFFAGGGTNNPFTRYSAYCLGKIALIKMCELIDDETPDLNAFIIGPGFVDTRIHRQTLASAGAAGENLQKTLDFIERGDGASFDEIYACIQWCVEQGRDVIGGRNLSLVHDPWRDGGRGLADALRGDPDAFRLRRATH